MIPEAAVEAAAKVLGLEMGAPVSWSIYRHLARKTLEASAMHMLAGAWDEGWNESWNDGAGWPKSDRNPYRPTP